MKAVLGGLFWVALYFAFGATGFVAYLVAVFLLVVFLEGLVAHYKNKGHP